MEQSEETLIQSPNPPHKRPRLDLPWSASDAKALEEEKERLESIRQSHLIQALYENAMNGLIETTGVRNAIEDEAVSMAIRSHGLTCTTIYQCDQRESFLSNPSPYAFGPCSSNSRDDILSHAVTAAIKKKGLGAVDR